LQEYLTLKLLVKMVISNSDWGNFAKTNWAQNIGY
jgi:hypothetical protein